MSFDDTGPDTVYRIEGGKESAPYTPQIERSFDVEVDTGNAHTPLLHSRQVMDNDSHSARDARLARWATFLAGM